MSQPTLYLLIGYPGAGKTTVSKIIQESTGALHLWADHIRQEMFGAPTHSHEESLKLYDHLNSMAEELLGQGTSVIYDTNFNFFSDRERLREIAAQQGAKAVLIWVTTPLEVSRQRAVKVPDDALHRVLGSMTNETFNAIADKLQAPSKDEEVIKIDGTKLDQAELLRQLGL